MTTFPDVRFKRGNTVKNNAYTGPNGSISIDQEGKNVRVHNGTTAGGAFRLIDETAIDSKISNAVAGMTTGGFGYKGTWSFVVYNNINNTDHVITQGEMQNYTLSEIIDHMKKMATSKMKWDSKYVTYYDTNHYKVVFEITDFDLDCKKESIHGEYY